MVLDVVEDSEVTTGRRSEGLILSVGLVVQKAVSGLGIFLAGLVLATVNFPASAQPGHVDADVIWRLGFIFPPVMFLIYSCALLSLNGYRITRSGHEENLRRLAGEVARGGPPPVETVSDQLALAAEERVKL